MKHSLLLAISSLTADLCETPYDLTFLEPVGFHPFIGNSSGIDGVRFVIHLKERLTKSIVGQAASKFNTFGTTRLSRV